MIYMIYPNYKACVVTLATSELEEQIKYIYRLVTNKGGEPEDFILWKFHQDSLMGYWTFSVKEWLQRPNKSWEIKEDVNGYLEELKEYEVWTRVPDFMDNHLYAKHLMMSHRVHLLRKNLRYYKKRFPKLSRHITKYPKGLFYMISNRDPQKDESNRQWIEALKDKPTFSKKGK